MYCTATAGRAIWFHHTYHSILLYLVLSDCLDVELLLPAVFF